MEDEEDKRGAEPISGTPEMGVLLHHWHIGMDAIYGVGSMWYAGRPARRDQVERAAALLRGCRRMVHLDDDDRAELEQLIEHLEGAIK